MKIIKNPSKNQLDDIINDLSDGGVIVYPTDTIYGIGVDIHNQNAIMKVYDIKNRTYDKPLSVCVHDINQLKQVAQSNEVIDDMVNKLLPGPYTLLLRKKDSISDKLTANSDKIGVRIPDNRICSYLTKYYPITSTSANISGKTTSDNINDIVNQLGDNINCYIDAGILDNGASTIIDLTTEYPSIIRKGVYDEKILNEILEINLY